MPMYIDEIQIKTPTELKVGIFRLSKAERLASGKMVMDIIATKRRLDLSWEIIEDNELQKILDLLDSRVFHKVVYPDPQSGEEYPITAYVGDINQEIFQERGGIRYWRDVSMALIEQ